MRRVPALREARFMQGGCAYGILGSSLRRFLLGAMLSRSVSMGMAWTSSHAHASREHGTRTRGPKNLRVHPEEAQRDRPESLPNCTYHSPRPE
ncbi:hypothetical protein P12x_005893 [Tundrisphaera lichenicola]|uniref:hypothetical protein n=1 Tax=Tundrisphaera lichenicola TaxID=2029860 RepID=UPI003EC12E12